ncbi:unnamed protein product [Brachionus calyciflorus]|uniref:Uncharacterized protein n=1 Tax=Brachionus calyciflorus TaxID=104777 RepID=A0A813N4A8_9BILA|nr:unnamed protein product [Brachionus calyciflorus]
MVQQDFQNASNLFGENSRNNAVTNQLNITPYSTIQNQGYLNSNIPQAQRPAQNFNYYNANFQYNNYAQTGAQSSQNAQANNIPNYTSLTNVANSLAKSSQFLRNFPNVYENINNNYNNTSTKNGKALIIFYLFIFFES